MSVIRSPKSTSFVVACCLAFHGLVAPETLAGDAAASGSVAEAGADAKTPDAKREAKESEAKESETNEPAKKDDEPTTFAIVGATIYPASRPLIRRGTIVWRGEKIVAVGSEIDLPDGAIVIDGSGRYVAPGFVSLVSAGVGVGRAQGDLRHSLDPYELDLRLALASGITTTLLLDMPPTSGFGRDFGIRDGSGNAIIKLTHGELDEMLVTEPAVRFYSLPRSQLALNLYDLRDRFRRAKRHLEATRTAKEKKTKPPKLDRSLATYVALLQETRPIVLHPVSRQQVDVAFELAGEYGLRFVFFEPKPEWGIGSECARRGIPIAVRTRGPDFDFNLSQPAAPLEGDIPSRHARAFSEVGALVSILPYRRSINLSGLAGRGLETLSVDAAFAVRGGLDEDEALRSITLRPAQVLRIDERVGSLEAGKDADILLLSAPPLDYRSAVLKVWIEGREYFDREASRLLREVPVVDPSL